MLKKMQICPVSRLELQAKTRGINIFSGNEVPVKMINRLSGLAAIVANDIESGVFALLEFGKS